MGAFTKIPTNTFDNLQLDAGVLCTTFDPTATTPAIADANIICATTGGITITCTPTYTDFGEDVDNCPNNMMELKHIDGWECSIAFNALGSSAANLKLAIGAATQATNKVTPKAALEESDFTGEIWWVGDRADGGFVAVKLMNVLSNGMTITTTKKGKGQIAVTLVGHVSMDAQTTVPMEFYSYAGA